MYKNSNEGRNLGQFWSFSGQKPWVFSLIKLEFGLELKIRFPLIFKMIFMRMVKIHTAMEYSLQKFLTFQNDRSINIFFSLQ